MEAIFTIFLILIVLVISNIKVVPQAYAYVIERFGGYHTTWSVGLHIKIPFIDRISKRVNLKEQVVDFPPQPVITKDNVSMQIDTVVYFQITDPKLYTYGVVRPMMAIENLSATTLRHIIGDLERLSDHAVNFVESAEELRDKRISFSAQAISELGVLRSAVTDILNEAYEAFVNGNMIAASNVEPIEEVVDELRDKIKLNHIIRLQKSECTIEHGFVLSDLLTNFERVSDHCSNIASCVVEIANHDSLEMHKYQSELKHQSKSFEEKYAMYKVKYSV